MKKHLTVSAVTATQIHRWNLFGDNLIRCVKNQTALSSIIEWVIVVHDEATPDSAWMDSIRDKIYRETGIPVIQIHACPRETYPGIADCREFYNQMACGEIIMAFDDDDYYPPMRVEHGLQTFAHNKRLMVAGCPDHYFYDYDLGIYGQMKIVDTPNRCTNYTLMYRRVYAQDNHYRAGERFSEEKAFLNDFKEKMARLNPKYAGLQIFHGANTFNKRRLVTVHQGKVWDPVTRTNDIAPSPDFDMTPYRETYQNLPDPSLYDIVYYCGFQADHFKWLPSDTNLTGSEQAVIKITRQWAAMGKRICVFADLKNNVQSTKDEESGVDYFNSAIFTIKNRAFNYLVIWRTCGFTPLWIPHRDKINAKRCIYDVHDTGPRIPDTFVNNNIFHENDLIMVKSVYHRDMTVPTGLHKKTFVIQNGLEVDRIRNHPAPTSGRDMYRFIYTSDYMRGLVPILRAIWPHIREKEPRAELHLYYGTNAISDREKLMEIARAIYGVHGVCDHGRVSMDVVIEARKKAGWHLYTSHTTAETDCLSIKESWVAGCIPILLNRGLFAERPGVHLDDVAQIDGETGKQLAEKILELMANPPTIPEDKFHVPNWEEVGRLWINAITLELGLD